MYFECGLGADKIYKAVKEALEWKFIGMVNLEAGIKKEITVPEEAGEIWFIAGYKNDKQIYGGVSSVLPKTENGKNIVFFW